MVDEEIKQGYKPTEIGIIPIDWEIDIIKNHTKITTGTKNTQDKIDDGKYPFFVRSQKVERINTYSFEGEAVLTAGDGVGTGKVFHYINGKFDFHQRVYKISNFDDKLDGYFFYLFFSKNFYNRIMSLTAKSSVDSVRMEMIADMKILLPSKEEQSTIVQVLTDIDKLIELFDRLIEKKKNIKQGAMQELLTGKRRLSGFKEDWEIKQIKDILSYEQPAIYIVENSNYSNSYNTPVLTANKAFILGYTDENEGIYNNYPVIIFDDFTLENKYVDFPFKVKSSAIKILKIKDGKSNLWFIFNKIQLIKHSVGDHKRYYISEYQNIEISIPSPNEQSAIAQILLDMNREIDLIKQKREKLNQLKIGMMEQLLTGRIRLK